MTEVELIIVDADLIFYAGLGLGATVRITLAALRWIGGSKGGIVL